MYYNPMESGKRMKQLRKQLNWGIQDDVGHALNLADGTYGNIERGQVISVDLLIDIAHYFNVSVDYILFGVDSPSGEQPCRVLLTEIRDLCPEIKDLLSTIS